MEAAGELVFRHYSPGKLLISGEYLVLRGAKAWAVPLKYGQHMEVYRDEGDSLCWEARDHKGITWFSASFDDDLNPVETTDQEICARLEKLLGVLVRMSPGKDFKGYSIVTRLDYPAEWGLGSSATLVANLAAWKNVPPLDLHFASADPPGSGFDVAVAAEKCPLIYRIENGRPLYSAVEKYPQAVESLYFIYSGRKQESRSEVKSFENIEISPVAIREVSQFTEKMAEESDPSRFARLMEEHEYLIAGVLGRPGLKDRHFPNYGGSVKSLGAWGGDFFLASAENSAQLGYFRERGYSEIFPWKEFVSNLKP